MKKLISLLLAVLLTFSLALPCFADETSGQEYLTRSVSGSLLDTDIDFDAGYSDHRAKVVYHIVCGNGSETFTVYSNIDSR